MRAAVALARRSWRQLTSMRTALVLLFLLAVAAIPGSLLPQYSLGKERVEDYLAKYPKAGPWLDRFGFFEVYSSPWFAAIYLLLFTSLVGCLVPRLRDHATALLRTPPDAPARLDRLPHSTADVGTGGDPAALAALLRARRYRTVVREHADGSRTVSAEKGYLKETGNLVFHFALLGLLVGVALGSWYGWHGNRLLVAGSEQGFCSTLAQYDEYSLGPRVTAGDLPPFCLELTTFKAEYLPNGQPVQYEADIRYSVGSGDQRARKLRVNDPLRLDGANVYLLGHGYAPVLRFTDRYGRTQTNVAAFLPDDAVLTSRGVAAFPDANVDPKGGGKREPGQQVAFRGVYLPTVPADATAGASAFPAERDPRLMLERFVGDLGVDGGEPQSVYALNHRQIALGRLKKDGEPMMLKVGEKKTFGDGSSVEFVGTRPWVTLTVRHDPGEKPVLAAAGLLVAGLLASLAGRRRRVWFRVAPDGAVSAGGLPRSEQPGFAEEYEDIVRTAREKGTGHG